jgi:hypothetical protein
VVSTRCPACGMHLPAQARFCAGCGVRQPASSQSRSRAGADVWVLVVFGVGAAVSGAGAFLYAALAIDPIGAPNSTLDPAVLRTGATILAAALGILCVAQVIAVAGLARGREWGRIAATVACVAWCLTCVGLPLSIVVLNSIWRRKATEPELTLS